MKQIALAFMGVVLALLLLLVGCQQTPDTSAETTTSPTLIATPTQPSDPETQEPAEETAPETAEEVTTEPETEQSELVINAEEAGRILVAYYKTDAPASDSVYKSAENFRKQIDREEHTV